MRQFLRPSKEIFSPLRASASLERMFGLAHARMRVDIGLSRGLSKKTQKES